MRGQSTLTRGWVGLSRHPRMIGGSRLGNRLLRMRRRSRLAAIPVHRHALPQIAVDAGLVALAYFLAYRLRFDGGVPEDYQDLLERTLSFVVIGSIAIFTGFGLYRHWMRYSSQREYLRIVQAAVAAVLALVAYVAVV